MTPHCVGLFQRVVCGHLACVLTVLEVVCHTVLEVVSYVLTVQPFRQAAEEERRRREEQARKEEERRREEDRRDKKKSKEMVFSPFALVDSQPAPSSVTHSATLCVCGCL